MFDDRSYWPDLTPAEEVALFAACPVFEEAELAADADRYDAQVAAISAVGLDHGSREITEPPDPELWPRVRPRSASERLSAAVAALDSAQRRLQAVEAGRIVALLSAYDTTMADATDAGEPAGRQGWVARGFLMQAGRSLRMSERGAAHLLDTARSLREDLPHTWRAFLAGICPWRLAEIAFRQAEGLHTLDLPEYDEQAAVLVGTEASPELRRKLHALRERLDPGTAAHRRRGATANRQVTIAPLPDGQACLSLIGPAIDLAAVDDGLQRAAVAAHGHPDEIRGVQALRFDAAVDLLLTGLSAGSETALPADVPADADLPAAIALGAAVRDAVTSSGVEEPGDDLVDRVRARRRVPQRRPVTAKVLLVVPALSLAGHSDAPAELAGYGPIDVDQAAAAAAAQDSWTRVFTDPATGDLTAVDASSRAIPSALRAWLQARDSTCRAPGCSRPANRLDLDHVQRYEHHGPTAAANLVHLCRPHHGVKDDGCWSQTLEPNGRLTWRSRWGTVFTTEPAMVAAPVPPSGPDDGSPPPQVAQVPAPF